MKRIRILILFFVLTLLFFGGLVLFDEKEEMTPAVFEEEFPIKTEEADIYSSRIHIGGHELLVDVADTNEERMKGLSGRERLGENQGLLFIFDVSDLYGIWMKNMKFPIDILWVDEKFQVVDTRENVLPESFPEIFYPISPAKYVIEVPAGWVEKSGIKNGAMVNLN